MSTLARLDVARLALVPGGEASCRLSVTNNGQVVEAYRFTPLGDLAPYATVEPPELSLYPGSDGEVTISFSMPRNTSVVAAELPFAVMVQPRENPNDTAVPECVVDVAGFIQTDRELSPRMSQARWRTTHSLAVDNRGNHPIRVFLRGEDADDQLRIRCRPDVLVIDPGDAAFSKIKIRTSRIMWRGAPQTRPFRVNMSVQDAPASPLGDFGEGSAERPDGEDGTLPGTPATPADGQVVQGPILPRGSGKVAALAAAGLIALAALWFAVLRPTVRSAAQEAAQEAVTEQVAAVEEKAEQAQQQAAAAQQQAAAAGEQATQASGTAKQASTAVDDDQAARALSESVQPFNRRIVVTAAPGQDETEEFVVPDGQIVTVTDLVFESRGDIGTVRLLRDADVLITARSENFRTLDQHFVSPIIFTEGERIVYELQCVTPVQDQPGCEAGLYISGTTKPAPPPPPPPTAPLPVAGPVESPEPAGSAGSDSPESADPPESDDSADSGEPGAGSPP